MRVVIDYRPALRQRTGVGEYTHQLARALVGLVDDRGSRPVDVTLFSSSWKDRLSVDDGLRGAAVVDRRVPVALLNLAWHRFNWPPAESMARGAFEVAHSMHPLLMPARHAARVVTIHDLNFIAHPERTRAEIRRDYPALARTMRGGPMRSSRCRTSRPPTFNNASTCRRIVCRSAPRRAALDRARAAA